MPQIVFVLGRYCSARVATLALLETLQIVDFPTRMFGWRLPVFLLAGAPNRRPVFRRLQDSLKLGQLRGRALAQKGVTTSTRNPFTPCTPLVCHIFYCEGRLRFFSFGVEKEKEMANTWIKDAVFHMALKAIEAKLEGDEARVDSLCTMMDIHPWQSGAKDALVKLLVREYHLLF